SPLTILIIIGSKNCKSAFVCQSTYRTMPVINIIRKLSVTFLRNKVRTNRIYTLLRAVFVKLAKNVSKG
ncbi:MAG: hypothetical protein LIO69_09275, partial [Oscillospiraceae bacterium]|nr:hypothetical protein [Oscillospiraceae bacterium]